MLQKKRVTIKEVARAAGVSTQTVSRVLNNRPDVSAETRERIRGIIASLGYSPNALARSLIRGRSQTLGVAAYGVSYYGPSRVLTGIERQANELGYSMLLNLLRDPETNHGEEIFQNLLDRQVDGIIWAVPEIGNNREWVLEQQHRLTIPVVFINMHPVEGLSITAVDNEEGGRLATEHLIAQGYQRIGLIRGPDSWWETRQRERGWRTAMQTANLPDLNSYIATGDWYPSSGDAGLETLLDCHPDLQAVFVSNDPMAAGVLRAARRLGRRVPDDLAVVGFDNTPESAYYYPALTTIHQPLTELGGRAVKMIHQQLEPSADESELSDNPTQIAWMHPELVARDSSKRS